MKEVLADERGLIGKILMAWMMIMVALAIAGYDAYQIGRSNVLAAGSALQGTTTAVTAYVSTGSAEKACAAARAKITQENPQAKLGPDACKINTEKGQVQITVRGDVKTLIAGRLDFTEKWTKVIQSRTAGL